MKNRIRKLRKQENLTLEELGRRLDMGFSSLSHYETNKREPKMATWKKLADYFNVSVPYLQGVTNIDVPQSDRSYSKQEKINYIKKTMKALGITKEDLV